VCFLGYVGPCLTEIDYKSMERETFMSPIRTEIKSDEFLVMLFSGTNFVEINSVACVMKQRE
jgi:hypothetical protein